jgi:hypothetical protein
MALTHTVYFFFGGIDSVQNYLKLHAPNMVPVVSVYDAFSIEDARMLRTKLGEYTDENTVYIVRIEKISSPESQGVLLKICEELSHTHIIFSFSPRVTVFETLLSRGVVVSEDAPVSHFGKESAGAFYNAHFAERIKLFEKLTKQNPDLEPKTIVSRMIEDLTLGADKDSLNYKENGRVFLDGLQLLNYQKSSPKQIFEYIALMVKK